MDFMLQGNPAASRWVKRYFPAGFVWLIVGAFSLLDCSAATFTVSNTSDSGAGSLRQAILDANANSGLDTIIFQVPGTGVRTITPLTALPPINDPVVIDGGTQPGYGGQPLIELNGASAGNNAGLRLLSGNSTIRGLAINRFGGDGIRIEGLGTNILQGNVIGADPSGTVARANGQEGIFISGTWGNVIGGIDPQARNLIAANADHGVYLLDGGAHVVQGNFIGIAASGASPLGNAKNGVVVYNSLGNVIGGAVPGARNLIAGNLASGIYLNGSGSVSNLVQGNFIGTALNGNQALSNVADGITVAGAIGNLIGGANAGEGNLISGNGKAGVAFLGAGTARNLVQGNLIGTDVLGRTAVGNGTAGIYAAGVASNSIGGILPGAGNLISGNRQDGIFLSTNAVAHLVAGNLIGVTADGANALANLYNGISLSSAHSNTIGGVVPGARNLVSGNAHYGLQLAGGAAGNTIQGNYIGVDAAGRNSLSNKLSGLRLESPSNLIGGTLPGSGNLISGNGEDGIVLVGSLAKSNLVQGNYLGTVFDGSAARGNGRAGVGISGAPDNCIGGTADGAGNLISANGDAGIYLVDLDAVGNQILGNTIGTDVTGTLGLGNRYEGIYLEDGSSNLIGGSLPGAANLISGNRTRGIWLTNASWNVIQGNLVGTKRDGLSSLGNTFHNIECEKGANNNTIGGDSGAGNRIAFAQGIYAGVRIRSGSINNRIAGNAIFGNGALGIDLDTVGITSNDACDADIGANQQQNFPQLTQAVSGSVTGIRGTLNSKANSTFVLQFFASPACDSSGNGEGQIYLGNATVVTAANCNAAFLARFPLPLPAGYAVTATATDGANNTSEFSPCVAVGAVPQLKLSVSTAQQVTLTWTNTTTGFVLKETDSLSPPVQWTTVTNPPTVLNGQSAVSLPAGTGRRFYALSFE